MIDGVLNYVMKKAMGRLKVGTYARRGRNFLGRICVFHRGGGSFRKYRYWIFLAV